LLTRNPSSYRWSSNLENKLVLKGLGHINGTLFTVWRVSYTK